MALYLGEKWPAEMARTPPAFEREENKIWQDFLSGFADSYAYFHYNVKIGADRILPGEKEEPLKRMEEEIALKRIDAIGFRSGVYDIFEIRKRAGPGTLGQALTYETLWERWGVQGVSFTINIITDQMDIDTQFAARNRGITVFIV